LCYVAFAAGCLAQGPAAPADPAAPPASVSRDLFGPGTWAQTLAASLSDQIRHFPSEWGHGVTRGYAKRAVSEYGQVAGANLIESGVQRLHKEDPRYFRRAQGGFFRRTLHVIGNTVVVHSTSGGRTVSLALPAEAYGSWAIASRWYPRGLRGPGSILHYGSANVGMKMAGNFVREFWPDVKAALRHRPAPPAHTGAD
jgi:hypothetical protein